MEQGIDGPDPQEGAEVGHFHHLSLDDLLKLREEREDVEDHGVVCAAVPGDDTAIGVNLKLYHAYDVAELLVHQALILAA